MKTVITLFLLVYSFSAFAQYDSKGEDEISRFRPGTFWIFTGLRPGKVNKFTKYDRLIFDITYNDWIGDLKPFAVKPTSIGLGVNLMFDVPLTEKNKVAFGWGFNYTLSHIRHDNVLFINTTDNWTIFKENPVDTKSSFNYSQFSIPLELRFRDESWKHIKVHIGGKIGFIAKANEKTILEDPNGKTIIKDSHFPDLNSLQYSAHLRFGIRNLAIFGEYNFAPLFTNSQSTKLNVIRFGLSISLF